MRQVPTPEADRDRRHRVQPGCISGLRPAGPCAVREGRAGTRRPLRPAPRGTGQLVTRAGNELRHFPTAGVASGEQRDPPPEKYELPRRLRREENVTWQGKFLDQLDPLTAEPGCTRASLVAGPGLPPP